MIMNHLSYAYSIATAGKDAGKDSNLSRASVGGGGVNRLITMAGYLLIFMRLFILWSSQSSHHTHINNSSINIHLISFNPLLASDTLLCQNLFHWLCEMILYYQ